MSNSLDRDELYICTNRSVDVSLIQLDREWMAGDDGMFYMNLNKDLESRDILFNSMEIKFRQSEVSSFAATKTKPHSPKAKVMYHRGRPVRPFIMVQAALTKDVQCLWGLTASFEHDVMIKDEAHASNWGDAYYRRALVKLRLTTHLPCFTFIIGSRVATSFNLGCFGPRGMHATQIIQFGYCLEPGLYPENDPV
jgi:hypothetical protein